MRLAMGFREFVRGVSVYVEEEFDRLIAAIQAHWRVEHNDDGTHKQVTATDGGVTAAGPGVFAGVGAFEATVTVTGKYGSVTVGDVGTSAGGSLGSGIAVRTQYSKWDWLASGPGSSPGEWRFDLVDRTPSTGAKIVLRINNLAGEYALEPGLIATPPSLGRNDVGRRWTLHAQDITLAGTVTIQGGPTLSVGTGTPEGAVTAPVGSLFLRTNGGASTTLYVKESGTGNTGWVAK